MLVGEITEATITSQPVFRVTSRYVMMEANCIDAGVRYRLYFSHPVLMYYCIRFCDVGTRHHFFGEVNVSAYTFEDSTKAFASIRMRVNGVRPIREVNEDGEVIPNPAFFVDSSEYPLDHSFFKLKFMIYKHVWENVNHDQVVVFRGTTHETFATSLSEKYDDLVNRNLVIADRNPVRMIERMVRRQTNDRRPTPRVLTVEYTYNDTVQRIDDQWESPSLTLAVLVNDATPLDPALFAEINVNQQQEQQPEQQ